MSNSILRSTKKVLGLDDSYTVFDEDVIMHINSVFSILNQLGIGPIDGFRIEDATALWSDFLGDDLNLNSVKTYVFLRVKLLFDPPGTSYLITAMNEQIKEFDAGLRHALPAIGQKLAQRLRRRNRLIQRMQRRLNPFTLSHQPLIAFGGDEPRAQRFMCEAIVRVILPEQETVFAS